jgi:hypothetical protein
LIQPAFHVGSFERLWIYLRLLAILSWLLLLLLVQLWPGWTAAGLPNARRVYHHMCFAHGSQADIWLKSCDAGGGEEDSKPCT